MDMKDYSFLFTTTVILLIRADSGLFEGLTRLTCDDKSLLNV